MKVKIFICWIFSSLTIVSGFLFINPSYETKQEIINFINIKVIGAVINSKTVKLKSYSTIKDLLSKIKLRSNADRDKLDLNRVLVNDQTIIIPILKNKEKLKIIKNIKMEDLDILGVSSKLKKKLLNYFKETKNWTWQDIDSLSGVGPITLKLLKEQLDINSS